MKLNLFSIVFAAATLCPSGYAFTLQARADVPFAFHVGDTALPAGDYQISEARGLLNFRQTKGKLNIFHLVTPASRPGTTPDAKLKFTRYGDEYYLTNLWNAGSKEGLAVPPSKGQKALAMRSRTFKAAAISLQPASH